MTKIKLCGLKREEDIAAANTLMPEYAGFVFAPKSSRCISFERAKTLRKMLSHDIMAVGVFVDETKENVLRILESGVIDMAQLHGSEDGAYIKELKSKTDKKVIKAFKISSKADIEAANVSGADYVLLDSGAGTGCLFNWELIDGVTRPYFLAGGLNTDNVGEAILRLSPFAVDVSSGIETDGFKDKNKMAAFVKAVRAKN